MEASSSSAGGAGSSPSARDDVQAGPGLPPQLHDLEHDSCFSEPEGGLATGAGRHPPAQSPTSPAGRRMAHLGLDEDEASLMMSRPPWRHSPGQMAD